MRIFYLNVIFILTAFFCFSSCTNPDGGIQGSMTSNDYDGMKVSLFKVMPQYVKIDSTTVSNRTFTFNIPDSVAVYEIILTKGSVFDIPVATLPVVAGEGQVKVFMGDKVVTSGTPANDAMQDFLLSLDNVYDKYTQPGIDKSKALSGLKDFLREQILIYKDNIVGAYILNSFADRFPVDEYTELKSELNPEYSKFIK